MNCSNPDWKTSLIDRRNRTDPIVELVQSHPDARVDVHVLSYSEPFSSLQKTLKSLESLPCNVWLIIGGFQGSIGAARAFAFTFGTAEFVSFVDDDDEIVQSAFIPCLESLEQNPEVVGVYTDTAQIRVSGTCDVEKKGRPWRPIRQLMSAHEITHLKIMRRCHVEPYLDELARWPTYEEYVLCGLMADRGPWMHLPIVGAYRRQKPDSESSMRLASRALWSNAVARVLPILIREHDARHPSPSEEAVHAAVHGSRSAPSLSDPEIACSESRHLATARVSLGVLRPAPRWRSDQVRRPD